MKWTNTTAAVATARSRFAPLVRAVRAAAHPSVTAAMATKNETPYQKPSGDVINDAARNTKGSNGPLSWMPFW